MISLVGCNPVSRPACRSGYPDDGSKRIVGIALDAPKLIRDMPTRGASIMIGALVVADSGNSMAIS
jgi:hypothetical protein